MSMSKGTRRKFIYPDTVVSMSRAKIAPTEVGETRITQSEMCDLVASSQGALLKIAKGILKHSANAEEILSGCTLSMLEQIAAGIPRARNPEEFGRWLRTIVRFAARRRAGQSDRDVIQTAGERNLQRMFDECGQLRRFEVNDVCDSEGRKRTVARSKRKPRLNEFDD
jgi:hypothetical protein